MLAVEISGKDLAGQGRLVDGAILAPFLQHDALVGDPCDIRSNLVFGQPQHADRCFHVVHVINDQGVRIAVDVVDVHGNVLAVG
jgi:hypothetical protein